MKLTPRLQMVAAQVPPGSVVADIGTDHGYIAVYLMVNRISRRVIATDANAGPLESARQTVALFNLKHRVSLRRGDGLTVLSQADGVDVVIVAGMGGELITRILDDGLHRLPAVKRLVLQPMNESGRVRRWLAVNRWGLATEELVQENDVIYEVVVAEPESSHTANLNSADNLLDVGPLLVARRHPLLAELLNQRIAALDQAVEGAANARSARGKQRHLELQQQIGKLKEVLEWVTRQDN